MNRFFAAFAAILLSTVPSFAMTGAEWMRLPSNFRSGYAWGLVDGLIGYLEPRDTAGTALAMERRDCLKKADVQSDSFYQAVNSEFSKKPFYLTQQVAAVVIVTINELCPPQ